MGNLGLGNMRATPDLIAPSLTRNGGSQYSLNNNTSTSFATTPSSSSNLSSSGFNLHLLQHSSSPPASTSTQQQMILGSINNSNNNNANQQQQHFHHSLQELPMMSLLPDLSNNLTTQHNHNLNSVNLAPSSDDLQSIQSLLPSYRPAPDYETAFQLKYGHSQHHGGNVTVNVVPSVPVPTNTTQIYFDGQSNSGNANEVRLVFVYKFYKNRFQSPKGRTNFFTF